MVNELRIAKIDNLRPSFDYDKGNLVVTVKFDCVLKSGEIGRLAEMVASNAIYAVIGSNQLKLLTTKPGTQAKLEDKPQDKQVAKPGAAPLSQVTPGGAPADSIKGDGKKSAAEVPLTEAAKVKVLETV